MWSTKDLAWLEKNYPGLRLCAPDTLEGRLPFRMLHYKDQNYVRPNRSQLALGLKNGGVYLSDTYQVRIVWRKHGAYPNAYEIGGKIEAVAGRYGKSMLDMHTYSSSNNALCVANPMDLLLAFVQCFDLKQYIEGFLIPYLFEQTYYAQNKKWLWGELSHGHWGHLEWLGRREGYDKLDIEGVARHVVAAIGLERATQLFAVRCRAHHQCPCGSGKRTRHCHPDIREAIGRIRGELSRHAFALSDFA